MLHDFENTDNSGNNTEAALSIS